MEQIAFTSMNCRSFSLIPLFVTTHFVTFPSSQIPLILVSGRSFLEHPWSAHQTLSPTHISHPNPRDPRRLSLLVCYKTYLRLKELIERLTQTEIFTVHKTLRLEMETKTHAKVRFSEDVD